MEESLIGGLSSRSSRALLQGGHCGDARRSRAGGVGHGWRVGVVNCRSGGEVRMRQVTVTVRCFDIGDPSARRDAESNAKRSGSLGMSFQVFQMVLDGLMSAWPTSGWLGRVDDWARAVGEATAEANESSLW